MIVGKIVTFRPSEIFSLLRSPQESPVPISPQQIVQLRLDRDDKHMESLLKQLFESIDASLIASRMWHSLRVWDRGGSGNIVSMWNYAAEVTEAYEKLG